VDPPAQLSVIGVFSTLKHQKVPGHPHRIRIAEPPFHGQPLYAIATTFVPERNSHYGRVSNYFLFATHHLSSLFIHNVSNGFDISVVTEEEISI